MIGKIQPNRESPFEPYSSSSATLDMIRVAKDPKTQKLTTTKKPVTEKMDAMSSVSTEIRQIKVPSTLLSSTELPKKKTPIDFEAVPLKEESRVSNLYRSRI